MKYLCLVYFDEAVFAAIPEPEREMLWDEAESLVLELQRGPGFIAADALEPTSTAATLRKRGNVLTVTDGPFAETKEQLGGFLLIDAENLAEALAVATRIPSVRFGSVEIRPVRA